MGFVRTILLSRIAAADNRRKTAGPRLSCCALLAFLVLAGGCSERRSPTLKTLSTAKLARSEPSTLGQERISLEGWVTAVDSRSHSIYLQDTSGGVRVKYSRSVLPLHTGDYVDVSGILVSGFPSPTFVNPSFQIRKPPTGTLPPVAAEATLSDLLSGRFQYKLCRLNGVVHGVGIESSNHPTVKLVVEGQLINVPIPDVDDTTAREFTNARSSWEGVPDVSFDLAGRVTEITLCAPHFDSIRVLEPAPPDSKIPSFKLSYLLRRPPGDWQAHQVRVRGTIDLGQSGDGFVIRDGAVQSRLKPYFQIPFQSEQSSAPPDSSLIRTTLSAWKMPTSLHSIGVTSLRA